MPGYDGRDQPRELIPCPPINEVVIARRSFLAGTAAVAGGLILGGRGLLEVAERVDGGISPQLWPEDSMRIEVAETKEVLNQDGHLNLFFGGFGQKFVNTEGYFNTIGRQELTATMVYPNGRFSVNDLADVAEEFLDKHNIKTVNIIGPSMGLPIGIKTFGTIAERTSKLIKERGNTFSEPITMPVIDQLIGFSSPSDKRDAYKGEVMSKIVTIARELKQPPELVWMSLYSYVDGPGDLKRGVDIRNLKQIKNHFELTWYQVLNGTSPEMALSQMIILEEFDAQRDSGLLIPMIKRGKTSIVYTTPSNYDNTVDNLRAISSYDGVFSEHDVLLHVLNTGNSGHANVPESIVALQKFYRDKRIFNGRNILLG